MKMGNTDGAVISLSIVISEIITAVSASPSARLICGFAERAGGEIKSILIDGYRDIFRMHRWISFLGE